jgi:serine/threonine protein kinase
MALQAGTRLGAYEIISPLGAGGMGEVYRARDTKLQRDVAVKILPETMARDAQRMARFEREAQVLASLNHPNIAAIYGLEESNGIRALVMELVEGETLGERIAASRPLTLPASRDTLSPQAGRGGKSNDLTPSPQGRGWSSGAGPGEGSRGSALATEDALPIAKQIAEALEYAHERGVIHRDLKPANVKITPEGTVKVLDFGLAKVLETQDTSTTTDIANSPTLSAMATQAGMILGTAAYMSPEQAKGQRVDRRADIWAFGCVLYEMLTGRKPFEGETISDVLASVIKTEPDWSAIPEPVPPSIQKLIRRCLTKDPKQRLRDIGEARITIEETISGVGEPFGLPREGEALPYPQPPKSPLRRALPGALAAVGFLLAAVLAVAYLFKSPAAPVQSTQSLIAAPENVSFAFEPPAGAPTLSPDGTRLVFPARDASGKESLWVRPLNSLTAQRLQGTDGGRFPFWAPDSRQLGFFQDRKLKKIDVTGGPPVLICDAPTGRGGAWSKDGVIVFAPQIRGAGLSSVPAAGGTPAAIATPKESGGPSSNRWPVFLPDGRHFLYLSGNLESPGTPKLGIHVGETGSNEQKFLL